MRELEAHIARAVSQELDHHALGLRLRYLMGGTSDDARTVDRVVIPERAGYFIGARMVEAAIEQRGAAWSARASAGELVEIARSTAASA